MAALIFLTSTPPTIEKGSGTWVGISVLRTAIVALGHEVALVAPRTPSRIAFNLRAPENVRETVERVHGFFANKCPIFRSLHAAIEITSSYKLVM